MSISFDHLKFTYFEDRKPVLAEITAQFDAGEVTVLTGASGCGKSTLLYLAAGVYPHAAGFVQGGSVTVDGTALYRLPFSSSHSPMSKFDVSYKIAHRAANGAVSQRRMRGPTETDGIVSMA